jgi:hypothetical protein
MIRQADVQSELASMLPALSMKSFAKKINLGLLIVLWIFIVACVINNWFFTPKHPGPQEGEPCGPAHHWVSEGTGSVLGPEMSCEPD